MKLKYFKSGTQGRFAIIAKHGIGHDICVNVFDRLNADFPNQQFGALYNAYDQQGYAADKEGIGDIEWIADSGGLQVITRGKEMTPELKAKIYANQAKYSDIAMVFDEMPLFIDGVASSVTDVSNRYFLADDNWAAGAGTGDNTRELIEVIRGTGSKSKAMLIVQGNSLETYKEYFDAALSKIPDEYYSSIAGVALADTANGIAEMESTNMIAAYRFLDIPPTIGNRLHLLGIGALNRLLPAINLLKSGYLQCELSYDSTTHTGLYIKGAFFTHRPIKLGKQRSVNSDIAVNSVYDLFGEFLGGTTREEFAEYFDETRNMTMTQMIAKIPEGHKNVICRCIPFLFSQASIYNFMTLVENAITTDKRHKNDAFNQLLRVKDQVDYITWRDSYGRFLKSKHITSIGSKDDVSKQGLGGFF